MTDAGPWVLLVEDEPQMRRFLRTTLTSQGYGIREAATAAEGLAILTTHPVDLVLLDLGLPDADGIEVTRRIREWSQVPIVVVSARGREEDKVEALDAGADDYLTKPFGTRELTARMRVAMRRAARRGAADDEPVKVVGDLRIDRAQRRVSVRGELVHLTPTEYRLLGLLVDNAGRVLTHRQILKEVWGPRYATQSHYVRVYMAELRKKLELDPTRPRLLFTEPGVGYVLREPEGPPEG
ncbi:MAG: response regulator [Polyangiales bacterium]